MFVRPFVRPSVSPPQALSGLKSALSGLKSTLSGLGGILTSGKDFFLTSGMKLNSHQWEREFIPLVRKKYFPLVRIFKKKNSHQWAGKGGNGGKRRNREEEGGKGLFPMRLGQDLGPKAWR